jgi:hypothetical protein
LLGSWGKQENAVAPPDKPKDRRARKTRRKIAPPVVEAPWEPLFEKYAGLGSESVKLSDVAWLGDDGRLDLETKLAPLIATAALSEIVRHVIDSNPPTAERAATGSSAVSRQKAALKALLGKDLKRGPQGADMDPLLVAIARHYVEAYYFRPGELELDTIIADELVKAGRIEPDLDPASRSNALRKPRTIFNENKDVLIARVTGEWAEALSRKDKLVREVLRLLEELGIVEPPR